MDGLCAATLPGCGVFVGPSELRGRFRSTKRVASLRFLPATVGVEPTGVALLDI